MPLRIAASGGRIPLDDDDGKIPEKADGDDVADDPEEACGSDVTEELASPKKKTKKERRYSEFAYKSKVDALVAELKQARDEDCTGKVLVFITTLNFATKLCLTMSDCSQEPKVFAVYFDARLSQARASKAWLRAQDADRGHDDEEARQSSS